ncbi:MAG: indole-3-glycerol phosphate synthase TrpC [Promethearchaeota archaeon]
MTSNKINEIVEKRKHSIAEDIKYKMSLSSHIFRDNRKNLSKAIRDNSGISIISEIKPASPTLGDIRKLINIKELAKEMESAGAVGLSILTEPNYFNGSYENLKLAVKSTKLPCIMKDFVVDSVQCFIAYQLGATNILIINSIVDQKLENLVSIALECGLEPLIEIHEVEEIKDIKNLVDIGLDPTIIGVNNRNLKTLDIDLNTSNLIIPQLKQEFGNKFLVISESGIQNYEDIQYLQQSGADGYLIGSSIMKSDNIYDKIISLRGGK